MKNLSILIRDREEKLTDFQEKDLGLFRPFINAIFGWPVSLSFDSPGELDGGPSHGQSSVN